MGRSVPDVGRPNGRSGVGRSGAGQQSAAAWVRPDADLAEGPAGGARHAFGDQVDGQVHETRIIAGRGDAQHADAERVRGRSSDGVEVVDHLHVVGDEAERHDDHRGHPVVV